MKRDFFRRSNHKAWTVAAVTAAFFVPLGLYGAPALAGSDAASASQYQYKVTICHRTHSKTHPFVQISVGAPAAKAHLRHGDFMGKCPPPPAPPTTAGKSDDHGQSGDHGNGNGNGNGHGKGKGK